MEQFIIVPIKAEFTGDIDLNTRAHRVYLQTAFREMVKELSDEMQISTQNFFEIDTDKVYLVCVSPFCFIFFFQPRTHDRRQISLHSPNTKVHVQYNEEEKKWTARLKLTFKTNSERPGWTRTTILSSLKCCRRIKILVRIFFLLYNARCILTKLICRQSKL